MLNGCGTGNCGGARLVVLALAAAGAGILAVAGRGGGNHALAQGAADGAKPDVCMARYVPERDDDIFWENDRTAHRIYGPALTKDPKELLTTPGIDVWVKNVRTLYMDKQLKTGQQHENHGEGMDCYDVQHTLGCGGLGIWDDASGKLMASANWADKGGFVSGSEVASFWVTYDAWDAGSGRKVKEKRTFTLPAGTNFTRLVSTIDDVSGKTDDLMVAIGIAKRKSDGTKFKGEGQFVMDKEKGIMLYWEPEQFNKTVSYGHTGCAVLVDPKSVVKFVTDDPTQNFVVVKITPGKSWAYYTGACWSLGLDFHTEKEWEDYARSYKTNFDAAH